MFRELAIQKESGLAELGKAANHFASKASFEDYQSRKAKNTLRRQKADLALFADFLASTGVAVGDLAGDPEAWRGVTWGLVAAFQKWLLGKGYAVGSVNVRVSTVKTYAKLAFKAGILDATEYALIRAVEGYSRKEGKRVDEKRESEGLATRVGSKKAESVIITEKQAKTLKSHPDTPQGRRDCLLMCLLLDHGLRVGEVVRLRVEDFDLGAGVVTFYREKVDKTQVHKLTGDTFRAARAYIVQDTLGRGPLLQGSVKGGELTGVMSGRAITWRVQVLGKKLLGVDGFSPHDCRHFAATKLAQRKTLRELMDIFGWSSPAMAARYIQSGEVVDPA